MKNRVIGVIMTFLLVVGMFPAVPIWAETSTPTEKSEYDLNDGSITTTATAISGVVQYEVVQGTENYVTTADAITIKQTDSGIATTNTITINVASGVTASAILAGVNIAVSSDVAAALATSGEGDVVIELDGDNTLTSGKNHAGLEKNNTGKLVIKDDNGINGTITATGGLNGAGIGGGNESDGSNIIINSGTVTAQGGKNGAGIGGGAAKENTTNSGNSNTATYENGIGSDIIINGGTVTANGGH